ncbi:hypothetical protein KIPB_011117, partial [Kipferlia bialata]
DGGVYSAFEVFGIRDQFSIALTVTGGTGGVLDISAEGGVPLQLDLYNADGVSVASSSASLTTPTGIVWMNVFIDNGTVTVLMIADDDEQVFYFTGDDAKLCNLRDSEAVDDGVSTLFVGGFNRAEASNASSASTAAVSAFAPVTVWTTRVLPYLISIEVTKTDTFEDHSIDFLGTLYLSLFRAKVMRPNAFYPKMTTDENHVHDDDYCFPVSEASTLPLSMQNASDVVDVNPDVVDVLLQPRY